MKKDTNQITFKSVLNETKKVNHGFSMHLFYFALFTICSIALAYLAPYTLILTIPILVVPSYFAFSSMNAIKGARYSEEATFFKLYKSYFSQFFLGGYRLLIGLLKAILTYTVLNTVIFSVYERVVLSKNAEYNALIQKLQINGDITTAYDEMLSFMSNNEAIEKAILLISTIAVFVAILVFLQHIAKHSVKMRRNLFSKHPFPVRQYHYVDRAVRRDNRKFLFSTYFRTCWFIQLLIVLAGVGGIVFSYFFLKLFNTGQAISISLFLMFVLTLPFLNYISKVQDMIYVTLMDTYEDTFGRLTLEFINKYRDKIGIPDEDAKKIEEILNATKKKVEDPPKDEDKNE